MLKLINWRIVLLLLVSPVLLSCKLATTMDSVENESTVKTTVDTVLVEKDGYILYQSNVDQLILLGEFLARATFSTVDKQALRVWAPQDFVTLPDKATAFYTDLSTTIMPKLLTKPTDEIYRANLYRHLRIGFDKDVLMQRWDNGLMDVVERYNPPRKEAAQLAQFYANHALIQQQQQRRMFQHVMKVNQQTSALMMESLRDHSSRTSIMLSGNVIVGETDHAYRIERPDGKQEDVVK